MNTYGLSQGTCATHFLYQRERVWKFMSRPSCCDTLKGVIPFQFAWNLILFIHSFKILDHIHKARNGGSLDSRIEPLQMEPILTSSAVCSCPCHTSYFRSLFSYSWIIDGPVRWLTFILRDHCIFYLVRRLETLTYVLTRVPRTHQSYSKWRLFVYTQGN